jgi:DNA-binding protein HU-beta
VKRSVAAGTARKAVKKSAAKKAAKKAPAKKATKRAAKKTPGEEDRRQEDSPHGSGAQGARQARPSLSPTTGTPWGHRDPRRVPPRRR